MDMPPLKEQARAVFPNTRLARDGKIFTLERREEAE
jgi:hypothetical protein